MSRQALGFLPRGFQWSPPGVPSRYVSVRVVSLVAFLAITVLILCTVVARSPTPVVINLPSPPTDDGEPTFVIPTSGNSTLLELPDVAALLAAIRTATERASRGRDVTFTREAEHQWNQQHPCRARDELQPLYALRRIVADVARTSIGRRCSRSTRLCIACAWRAWAATWWSISLAGATTARAAS